MLWQADNNLIILSEKCHSKKIKIYFNIAGSRYLYIKKYFNNNSNCEKNVKAFYYGF